MFGTEMGVETEGHLQFVDGLGSDARGENLVQPFETIMITFEPANAFLDG